ncbi:MAG: hypothetical protein HY779_02895 [Rubrobacteridae bacterium]|nr:hypothetical protein [Rubrobacteridae bacterium]
MKLSNHIITSKISDFETLIMSTITGAVDIIDNDVYLCLASDSEQQIMSISPSILDSLKRRGYLVDSDEAEKASIQKLGEIMSIALKDLFQPKVTCICSCLI